MLQGETLKEISLLRLSKRRGEKPIEMRRAQELRNDATSVPPEKARALNMTDAVEGKTSIFVSIFALNMKDMVEGKIIERAKPLLLHQFSLYSSRVAKM